MPFKEIYLWDILIHPKLFLAGWSQVIIRLGALQPTSWKQYKVVLVLGIYVSLYDLGVVYIQIILRFLKGWNSFLASISNKIIIFAIYCFNNDVDINSLGIFRWHLCYMFKSTLISIKFLLYLLLWNRMILKYLIPVKLSIGVLPSDWLLQRHNLVEVYCDAVLFFSALGQQSLMEKARHLSLCV